jgi:tetratricopeptide (TPR) repeat protein
MFNSGLAEFDRGDAAAAMARFDAVLALRRATLDADHPAVAEGLQGRSEALFGLGRYDEALADARQALTIIRAKADTDPRRLNHGLWLIGHVQFLRGEQASAGIYWDGPSSAPVAHSARTTPISGACCATSPIPDPATRRRDPAD